MAHVVKQMLMRRSQLQPVMNAAAAGGKRIATYHNDVRLHSFGDTFWTRTRMRRMSEERTMAYIQTVRSQKGVIYMANSKLRKGVVPRG